jgi:hypothetical protein
VIPVTATSPLMNHLFVPDQFIAECRDTVDGDLRRLQRQ